jgi:hypothetical protein
MLQRSRYLIYSLITKRRYCQETSIIGTTQNINSPEYQVSYVNTLLSYQISRIHEL